MADDAGGEKKRRGRPAKPAGDVAEAKPKAAAGKRGRPAGKSDGGSAPKKAKGRGRPKASPKKKGKGGAGGGRGRGRPKKAAKPAENEQSSGAEGQEEEGDE